MANRTSQSVTLNNVPLQPTRFIGRESEIEKIVNLLQDDQCRLLTLVGLGGIGKTRLCIETVKRLSKSQFEHGVYYVPLAPLTSADDIIATVLGTLGLIVGADSDPRNQLTHFLSRRNLLLVMDNYEHVLDDVQLVADILNAAPQVKILVTSREVLNLSIEQLWHVHGMSVPAHGQIANIDNHSAPRLFAERARWLRRDFSIDDQIEHVIRICRLVEGLPLAIELAASWLKSLSCAEIVNQLEGGIEFLTTRNRDISKRHRSIQAVFNHSWDLLSTDEQQVFRRLSVFRGGFTLEAAQAVAGAELDALSGLVEKSMIRLSAGRYDIHELLRQFADAQLIQSGETEEILDKQMRYFSQFMTERIVDLKGRRQIEALDEIQNEIDNIREAWHRVCQLSRYDLFDGILECFIVFFDLRRYPPITKPLYQYAIDTLDQSTHPHHGMLRNRLHVAHLYAQMRLSNALLSSQEYLAEMRACLELAEQLDDKLSSLFCLMTVAEMNTKTALPSEMRRALAISEALNDPYYLSAVLDMIAFYYTIVKKDGAHVALDYSHRHLEVAKASGNQDGIATAYSHLSHYHRFWGKIEDALYFIDEAKQRYQQFEHIQGTAISTGLSLLYEFQLGRFDKFIRGIKDVQTQLESVGFLATHSFTYMMCAKVEAIAGNYESGKRYISQALENQSNVHTLFHLHEAKIMCAIGLDDWDTVYEEAREALKIDFTFIGERLMVDFLPLMAFLYTHQQRFDRAVQVLGLAFSHPAGVTQWMKKWGLLMDLCATLGQELDHDHYNQAWDDGRQLDLKTAVTEMVSDLHSNPQENQLIEPLTPREQDVLGLFLVDNYEYKDIAEQLYISVTTVRTHAHHIYQKLGVKNRRQAILKAKQLGLV